MLYFRKVRRCHSNVTLSLIPISIANLTDECFHPAHIFTLGHLQPFAVHESMFFFSNPCPDNYLAKSLSKPMDKHTPARSPLISTYVSQLSFSHDKRRSKVNPSLRTLFQEADIASAFPLNCHFSSSFLTSWRPPRVRTQEQGKPSIRAADVLHVSAFPNICS